MEVVFSRQAFEKYSNTTFHENPSSGSRVLANEQTGMTKLIVAFGNFGKAPKKEQLLVPFSFMWLNNFKFVERQK
jgi:hypothetical protein